AFHPGTGDIRNQRRCRPLAESQACGTRRRHSDRREGWQRTTQQVVARGLAFAAVTKADYPWQLFGGVAAEGPTSFRLGAGTPDQAESDPTLDAPTRHGARA